MFVHHFRKSSGKTVAEALGGSGGLRDLARAVYIFGEMTPEDPIAASLLRALDEEDDDVLPMGSDGRILACEKMNPAEIPEAMVFNYKATTIPGITGRVPAIDYHSSVPQSATDVWTTWKRQEVIRQSDDRHTVEEACAFLLSALADGPRPTVEVVDEAKHHGISDRTLERARERLKVKAFQTGNPRAWYLRLPPPDDVPDTIPEGWTT